MPLHTDALWVTWATTTSTAATTQTWQNWTCACAATSANGWTPIERTPEQREQDRIATAEREAAQERAKALLLDCLTSQQRQEFERDGYFHVETRDGTRRYQLRPGRDPVRVHGEDGRRLSFCIHPPHGYPSEDTVLAQKLLLETDEEAFLRIANATPA